MRTRKSDAFSTTFRTLLLSLLVWIAVAPWLASGLFVPLVMVSFVLPAVVFRFSESHAVSRALLAALPNALAAASIALFGRGEWTGMIVQIILTGAACTGAYGIIVHAVRSIPRRRFRMPADREVAHE